MNALEKLNEVALILGREELHSPAKDAELIIVHSLGISRETLFRDNPVIDKKTSDHIDALVFRRLMGEPVQYIVGEVEFYGLRIRVGGGVLIPRPETELLVDEVLKAGIGGQGSGGGKKIKILDLCTGSGCIALALASKNPAFEVLATDNSDEALKYARENAGINSIRNARFLRGNLFEPVQGMKFDIIVSNPPYIRTSEIPDLQEEICNWEPVNSLDGGEDGLDYYRMIIASLGNYLLPGGKCFFEVGWDQGDALTELARNYGLRSEFKKDYSGHDRIMMLSF
ncbi:release factor glutamine methyltransferase [bacterium BMS3Abin07]|nr:release factor glutamine methyltransferase [bacterium BMS3Abin07]GBE33133.1 release factor glutamine methyltransferase [bacterium BMS3Bbin05]HDO22709.1 peptide chain release factor N(5)-glutamine methyltransferase [Nitrospirota bacterium]HDZ87137.1 peptide chain release factor N(5)-glutamine methyltransferase [Nitrospirota bacterium]